MTGLDLISSSFRLIGVLASGETSSSDMAADGLQVLNDMLDSWSIESLMVPNRVRETFALNADQKDYTMGSGGDFNTTRPIQIENVLYQIATSTPVTEVPMRILNKDEYANVRSKALESSYPVAVYADGAYPLQTLSFWPEPNAAINVILYSWKTLTQLASINTTLSFPQGYQEALRFNLAIRLAPEYGKAVSEEIAAVAAESRANIQRANIKPFYARVDEALLPRPSRYNIITGEPR